MEEVDDHQETKDVGALSRMPLGVTRRETQLTETPETLESRMQANLHVRFGGGPSEKESTRTTSLVAYPTPQARRRPPGCRPLPLQPARAVVRLRPRQEVLRPDAGVAGLG